LTDPLSDLPDSVHFPLIKRSQKTRTALSKIFRSGRTVKSNPKPIFQPTIF
jgi:hypothetical protein